MELSFERNIASRGWHVYLKTVWQNPHRGEKLEAKKKDNEETTKIDQKRLKGFVYILSKYSIEINSFRTNSCLKKVMLV